MKKTIIILLTLTLVISTGCENRTSEEVSSDVTSSISSHDSVSDEENSSDIEISSNSPALPSSSEAETVPSISDAPSNTSTAQIVQIEMTAEVFGIGEYDKFSLGVTNDINGSTEDLTNWQSTFDNTKDSISNLIITERAAASKGLSSEQAESILNVIGNLALNVIGDTQNPPSGSNVSIIALDENEDVLWYIILGDTFFHIISNDKTTNTLFDNSNNDITGIRDMIY